MSQHTKAQRHTSFRHHTNLLLLFNYRSLNILSSLSQTFLLLPTQLGQHASSVLDHFPAVIGLCCAMQRTGCVRQDVASFALCWQVESNSVGPDTCMTDVGLLWTREKEVFFTRSGRRLQPDLRVHGLQTTAHEPNLRKFARQI